MLLTILGNRLQIGRGSAMNESVPGTGITRRTGKWNERLFSNAVLVPPSKSMLYLAGVGAEDDDDGHTRHVGDIVKQSEYVFSKIRTILAAYNADLDAIVKMTGYVTDAEYREPYTRVRQQVFDGYPLPTHTFVVVQRLAWPDMLVEVDVFAAVDG